MTVNSGGFQPESLGPKESAGEPRADRGRTMRGAVVLSEQEYLAEVGKDFAAAAESMQKYLGK